MYKKFLIYKASGGMTHMLRSLDNAISIAKSTKRILIIDCKNHVAFGYKFLDIFNFNDEDLQYSEDYSLIPQDYKFKNIPARDVEHIRYKFNKDTRTYSLNGFPIGRENLNNNDDVSVICCGPNGFTIRNLRVNFSIKEMILDKFIEREKYISVHFRNTDMKNDISQFISKIDKASKKYNINNIYLSTDDSTAYDIIVQKLPNLRIFRYTIPENFNGNNIHYRTKDKFKVIYDCLTDIYSILKSDVFIPSMNSSLSQWIINMINFKKNIFDVTSKTSIIYRN